MLNINNNIIIMRFLFFILLSNCVNSELVNSNRASSSIFEKPNNEDILQEINSKKKRTRINKSSKNNRLDRLLYI